MDKFAVLLLLFFAVPYCAAYIGWCNPNLLSHPRNGYFTYDPNDKGFNDRHFARFFCNSGYTLVGNDRVWCNKNSIWRTNVWPSCVRNSGCSQAPSAILVIAPNDVILGSQFKLTATIQNPGNINYIVKFLKAGLMINGVRNPWNPHMWEKTVFSAETRHAGDWLAQIWSDTCNTDYNSQPKLLTVSDRPVPDHHFTNDCGKKYVFVSHRKTRSEAAAYCRNVLSMILAPVLDDLEIRKIAAATSFNVETYHTGYTRSGSSWRSPLCTTNVPWPTSKVINNGIGGWDCIFINRNGQKEAGNCATTRFFLCMEDMMCEVRPDYPVSTFDHTYYAINWRRSQADAVHYCQYINTNGGMMTINRPPEMQQACAPLIESGFAGDAYWTAPTSTDGGSTYKSCDFTIPKSWFDPGTRLIDDSNAPNVAGTKCTAIVLDVYNVLGCRDCNRFFCEITAC